jgi:glucose-6-phosphate isomerase
LIKNPYTVNLDPESGKIEGAKLTIRRLSDMADLYLEGKEVSLSSGVDPIIYEIYECSHPSLEGDMNFGTTVMRPGKVGKEFYMTKGHFHSKLHTGELYQGLKGIGLLLLQNQDKEFKCLKLSEGTLAYIPPGWAHRSVNIGEGPFIYFFIYPADAGHDYESIMKMGGFCKIVVEDQGKIKIQDNPRFKA